MRIGIAYDLKDDGPPAPGLPDDWQEEFDSPDTVAAIAAAIRAHGHEVVELGDGRPFVEKLLSDPPDLVFNIAEGRGVSRSREARVPAVCEMLGVPCTGSDPLTLAAALDKDAARRLVAFEGVSVPAGFVVPAEGPTSKVSAPEVPWPAIIKPAWEGSSKGIRGNCVVHSPAELSAELDERRRNYRQPLLVEEYIAGDELTVGVVGNDPPRVLGVMRLLPLKKEEFFVYSLEVKRDWKNRVQYECPAQLRGCDGPAVEAAALTAYEALGCRDIARIDFRLRGGVPYFLEANPLPGLNPETGDISLLARFVGVDHTELVGMILDAALARR
jgi:D-alanine-D-alanine ligase